MKLKKQPPLGPILTILFLMLNLTYIEAQGPQNRSSQGDDVIGQIVGGSPSSPGEFPWQVVVYPDGYLCGGSLIDAEWVLTAGHCVYENGTVMPPADVTVTLGEHNLNQNEGSEQHKSISQVILHPNYNHSTSNNDLALLKLSSPATLNSNVNPISLNTDSNIAVGTLTTVTGWGATSEGGAISNTLLKVDVPIFSQASCNSAYGGVTEGMICAGYASGGKDSCQGDSGGPLIMAAGNGASKQVGIVSWGDGCARPNAPGVYTRVSKYVDWIKEKTGLSFEVNELTIAKSVNDAYPLFGQSSLTYTLVIANNTITSSAEAVIVDNMSPELHFVGPVTLNPPQADAIVATSALSLPLLVTNLTITNNTTIKITYPVTFSTALTYGTKMTNTVSLTSVQVTTPLTDTQEIVIVKQKIYLPLITKFGQ